MEKASEKKGKINKAAIKNPVSGKNLPLHLEFKSMHINRHSLQPYVHGNKRRLCTTHDSKVIICILNRTLSKCCLRCVTHNSFRNLVQLLQVAMMLSTPFPPFPLLVSGVFSIAISHDRRNVLRCEKGWVESSDAMPRQLIDSRRRDFERDVESW